MRFESPIWQPIAILLSAINLVAVGFAAGSAEPWHAAVHAGLAVAFGLGAQRLRMRPRTNELQPPNEALEELQTEMSELRRELSETQERLDFTERVLAQGAESRRLDPDR